MRPSQRPPALDRFYGSKRLRDMTRDEVEQALRDVQWEVDRLTQDAVKEVLDAAFIRGRTTVNEATSAASDLGRSRGLEDAIEDLLLLRKVLKAFDRDTE